MSREFTHGLCECCNKPIFSRESLQQLKYSFFQEDVDFKNLSSSDIVQDFIDYIFDKATEGWNL